MSNTTEFIKKDSYYAARNKNPLRVTKGAKSFVGALNSLDEGIKQLINDLQAATLLMKLEKEANQSEASYFEMTSINVKRKMLENFFNDKSLSDYANAKILNALHINWYDSFHVEGASSARKLAKQVNSLIYIKEKLLKRAAIISALLEKMLDGTVEKYSSYLREANTKVYNKGFLAEVAVCLRELEAYRPEEYNMAKALSKAKKDLGLD